MCILFCFPVTIGTEFKLKNKIKFIKAEENKIVIFDSDVEHRGTTSTDTNFRYIINLNEKQNKMHI